MLGRVFRHGSIAKHSITMTLYNINFNKCFFLYRINLSFGSMKNGFEDYYSNIKFEKSTVLFNSIAACFFSLFYGLYVLCSICLYNWLSKSIGRSPVNIYDSGLCKNSVNYCSKPLHLRWFRVSWLCLWYLQRFTVK